MFGDGNDDGDISGGSSGMPIKPSGVAEGLHRVASTPGIVPDSTTQMIYCRREEFGNYVWLKTPAGLGLMSVDPVDGEEEVDVDWGPKASQPACERLARLLYGYAVGGKFSPGKVGEMYHMANSMPDEIKAPSHVRKMLSAPRPLYEAKMHDLMISLIAEQWVAKIDVDAWDTDLLDIVGFVMDRKPPRFLYDGFRKHLYEAAGLRMFGPDHGATTTIIADSPKSEEQ